MAREIYISKVLNLILSLIKAEMMLVGDKVNTVIYCLIHQSEEDKMMAELKRVYRFNESFGCVVRYF